MNIAKLTDFTSEELQHLLNMTAWDMDQATKDLDNINRLQLRSILKESVSKLETKIEIDRKLTVQILNAMGTRKLEEITQNN